jgi:hypothetical protein
MRFALPIAAAVLALAAPAAHADDNDALFLEGLRELNIKSAP